MLPLNPQRVAQKSIFQFFRIKFNFNRIKSVTKFRCVKTSSGKVVEQSISYEITEKCRTESISFHLRYWLKLTYPIVASTCMLPRRLCLKQYVSQALVCTRCCKTNPRHYTLKNLQKQPLPHQVEMTLRHSFLGDPDTHSTAAATKTYASKYA